LAKYNIPWRRRVAPDRGVDHMQWR